MAVLAYIPDDGKPPDEGGNYKPVTDREMLDFLDTLAASVEGSPDGTYCYYSDEYLEREAERRTKEDEERDREAFEEMNEAIKGKTESAKEQAGGNAFLELAPQAVDDHLKFEDASIVPGFLSFVSDVDVYLGLYKATLKAGVYFLKDGEELNDALVYTLTFDADEMIHAGDGLPYEETTDPKTGVTTRVYKDDGEREPLLFSAKIEPIPVNSADVPVEGGGYLTYLEYLAWLTMTTAPDDETRDAVFKSAYRVTSEGTAEKDELLKQTDNKADRRYEPITKLHQNMSNPALYDKLGVALDVAGRGEKKKGKEVNSIVSLECVLDEEDSIEITRQLSDFDITVYGSIATLYETGKPVFTLRELAEQTYGGGRITGQQTETVAKSAELLRRTLLKADISEEIRAHKLIDPETGEPWKHGTINDFLFSATGIELISTNGKKTRGYKFNDMPIGLRYAKAKKQLVSYETKYLDTRSAGSNTERNVVIRGYLLQRIAQAKGGKMSNTIRCEKIYDKAGINKESRTERNRVDKYVTSLMDLWHKQGLFKSYEIVGEGRRRMAKIVVSFAK